MQLSNFINEDRIPGLIGDFLQCVFTLYLKPKAKILFATSATLKKAKQTKKRKKNYMQDKDFCFPIHSIDDVKGAKLASSFETSQTNSKYNFN